MSPGRDVMEKHRSVTNSAEVVCLSRIFCNFVAADKELLSRGGPSQSPLIDYSTHSFRTSDSAVEVANGAYSSAYHCNQWVRRLLQLCACGRLDLSATRRILLGSWRVIDQEICHYFDKPFSAVLTSCVKH